jgi:hypothetical protein
MTIALVVLGGGGGGGGGDNCLTGFSYSPSFLKSFTDCLTDWLIISLSGETFSSWQVGHL